MSAIFPAKYPGQCAACDDRIKEGDQIMYDENVLIHAQCQPVDDLMGMKMKPGERLCGTCFLVHSGECF